MRKYQPSDLAEGAIYENVDGIYKYIHKYNDELYAFEELEFDEKSEDLVSTSGKVLLTRSELKFY